MLEVNATITGFSRIDFDKKKIRKVLRAEGAIIRKEARKLVARRAIASAPGEYPTRQTGALMRSIKVKVSKPGFMVKIAPYKTSEMSAFYPAFLNNGITGLPARKDRKAQLKNGKWRVAPRKNYMIEALNHRRETSRAAILNALQDSLIPRK